MNDMGQFENLLLLHFRDGTFGIYERHAHNVPEELKKIGEAVKKIAGDKVVSYSLCSSAKGIGEELFYDIAKEIEP